MRYLGEWSRSCCCLELVALLQCPQVLLQLLAALGAPGQCAALQGRVLPHTEPLPLAVLLCHQNCSLNL